MFDFSKEFIIRTTLDSIPTKLKKYKKEKSKTKRFFWYQFLYDKRLENGTLDYSNNAYYGNSKDSAKQRISHIKRVLDKNNVNEEIIKTSRAYMTSAVLELFSNNMELSISELLWGDEKKWKRLLPALFFLIVFDSLNAESINENLSEKAKSIMLESVIFSRELAKKEIEADMADGLVIFDIRNEQIKSAIFRLYQADKEVKFYKLFKETFVDSNYALDYLDRKLKNFSERLFDEVLNVSDSVKQSSLGYQAYKTYDIYYSNESREYKNSLIIRSDARYNCKKIVHYLDEEQELLNNSINKFIDDLIIIQNLQDERLGYRINKKKIFDVGLKIASFNEKYFQKAMDYQVQINQIDLSEEDLTKIVDFEL